MHPWAKIIETKFLHLSDEIFSISPAQQVEMFFSSRNFYLNPAESTVPRQRADDEGRQNNTGSGLPFRPGLASRYFFLASLPSVSSLVRTLKPIGTRTFGRLPVTHKQNKRSLKALMPGKKGCYEIKAN